MSKQELLEEQFVIGHRIREFRLASGLTLKAFASKIGISQGSMSDIENGKTKPSANTVVSIVQTTGINPSWLLVGEGAMFNGTRSDSVDHEMRRVSELMVQLDEASRRDVLKYVEEKNLLARLRRGK